MTTSMSVSVRTAARSRPMARLARAGLTARACVYLLIGVLAIASAFGNYAGEPDQQGALQVLPGTPVAWCWCG